MPVLTFDERIEKVFLPSTQKPDEHGNPTTPEDTWAWVEIDVSPIKAGDTSGLLPGMDMGELSITLLARRIKRWNYFFDEEQTRPIPIDEQGIRYLDIDDFKYLRDMVTAGDLHLDIKEKKTSLATSQPLETVEMPQSPPA